MNLDNKEQLYINAGIDDEAQLVHRKYWSGLSYDVVCKLPKGNYNLTFKLKKDAVNAYGDLRVSGINVARKDNKIAFALDAQKDLTFTVSPGGQSESIVTSLRKQLLNNLRHSQHESSLTH